MDHLLQEASDSSHEAIPREEVFVILREVSHSTTHSKAYTSLSYHWHDACLHFLCSRDGFLFIL